MGSVVGLLLFLGATWKSVFDAVCELYGGTAVFGVSVSAKRNYHVHLHNLAYVVVAA